MFEFLYVKKKNKKKNKCGGLERWEIRKNKEQQ